MSEGLCVCLYMYTLTDSIYIQIYIYTQTYIDRQQIILPFKNTNNRNKKKWEKYLFKYFTEKADMTNEYI